MAIPDNVAPVADPLPSDQQSKIKGPEDKWTKSYALNIVQSDWAFAESYRVNAHDWRYRNSDELYLAWVGQMYWEGTRVPRSSIGIPVIFQQIEAMLPKVVPPVTSFDNYHFMLDRPGDPDEELIALAHREYITNQLKTSKWARQVARALKSMAQYGNGIIEAGYEYYTEEYIEFDKAIKPTGLTVVNHPLAGPMQVPTGMDEKFTRKNHKETKQRPYARYVSMKDCFVDPNLETPFPQDAGYWIKRVYMRASQIKALAKDPKFTIPDDEYLTQLSKSKATANQDVTKLSSELFRYNMWNPSQDYTSDPAQKRIAVIEYTTPERKVWWLQGAESQEGIIYNEPNRYGVINYFAVPYAEVLDRWHALSVSDVAEGEQRLQQAIINARIDELALALHPPTLKRRGVTVPWYQLKRAPGRVVEVENPENDIKEAEIHNITQQAFIEVEASDRRTQRTTGMSDLASLGTPSSGGNSANRTAAGINTQAGATDSRMVYLVASIEDFLVEPVVNFLIKCNRKFADPKAIAAKLRIDPRFQQLDPLKVLNAEVSMECRASVKMTGKAQFMQVFPVAIQTWLNPELIQLFTQFGLKPDPLSIEKTFWDCINYTPRTPWFVKMTQQDVQRQQQAGAGAQQAELAKTAMKTQSDERINDKNLQTKFLVETLKAMLGAHTKHAELDDKYVLGLLQHLVSAHQTEQQALRPDDSGGAGEGSSQGD